MADALIQHLTSTLAQEELSFPPGPSEDAYMALQVAKETCLDCAALYGGPSRAGPVPAMERDRPATSSILPSSVLSTPGASRKASLLLDVERIFKERVVVYPHPQEPFEASRDSILFLAFKVAFRSLAEHVRLLSGGGVTAAGFRQLQIDVEFVRHMVPHYVSKDYHAQGSSSASNVLPALSSLLDDATSCAGDLCVDFAALSADPDEVLSDSRRAVRIAMDGIEESEIADRFIIQEG
jgi:hypothetical protein